MKEADLKMSTTSQDKKVALQEENDLIRLVNQYVSEVDKQIMDINTLNHPSPLQGSMKRDAKTNDATDTLDTSDTTDTSNKIVPRLVGVR